MKRKLKILGLALSSLAVGSLLPISLLANPISNLNVQSIEESIESNTRNTDYVLQEEISQPTNATNVLTDSVGNIISFRRDVTGPPEDTFSVSMLINNEWVKKSNDILFSRASSVMVRSYVFNNVNDLYVNILGGGTFFGDYDPIDNSWNFEKIELFATKVAYSMKVDDENNVFIAFLGTDIFHIQPETATATQLTIPPDFTTSTRSIFGHDHTNNTIYLASQNIQGIYKATLSTNAEGAVSVTFVKESTFLLNLNGMIGFDKLWDDQWVFTHYQSALSYYTGSLTNATPTLQTSLGGNGTTSRKFLYNEDSNDYFGFLSHTNFIAGATSNNNPVVKYDVASKNWVADGGFPAEVKPQNMNVTTKIEDGEITVEKMVFTHEGASGSLLPEKWNFYLSTSLKSPEWADVNAAKAIVETALNNEQFVNESDVIVKLEGAKIEADLFALLNEETLLPEMGETLDYDIVRTANNVYSVVPLITYKGNLIKIRPITNVTITVENQIAKPTWNSKAETKTIVENALMENNEIVEFGSVTDVKNKLRAQATQDAIKAAINPNSIVDFEIDELELDYEIVKSGTTTDGKDLYTITPFIVGNKEGAIFEPIKNVQIDIVETPSGLAGWAIALIIIAVLGTAGFGFYFLNKKFGWIGSKGGDASANQKKPSNLNQKGPKK